MKNSSICSLPYADKSLIISQFNETKADFPSNIRIYEIFEGYVEKSPDEIALIFEDETLTYKQLNIYSNQLARALRAKGVGPNHIVAIMIERSFEMIIGILAISKSWWCISTH